MDHVLASRATGMQDALRAAGAQAQHIGDLWNGTLALCTFVFVAIVAATIIAVWCAPRADAATRPDTSSLEGPEHRIWRRVGWGRPAREPADAAARRGRDVLLGASCARCHAVAGTAAHGRMAPDLTHLASRQTIGAGMFPNNRGHLAGWIGDPQALKPGVNMPANRLPPDDLQALLAYLETLR